MPIARHAPRRQRARGTRLFSGLLLHHLGETLGRREQVILFLNRRGYTPVLLPGLQDDARLRALLDRDHLPPSHRARRVPHLLQHSNESAQAVAAEFAAARLPLLGDCGR